MPTDDYYVGQTSNLEGRLRQHNDPRYKKTLHTKRRKGPGELEYSEEYETRSEAMRREKWFKTGMGREFIKKEILCE